MRTTHQRLVVMGTPRTARGKRSVSVYPPVSGESRECTFEKDEKLQSSGSHRQSGA